jgi:hypothetical protein
LDVVDGSVRIYVGSRAGEPSRGLLGANDDDSVLVGVVGWHGDGGWACCVGGAGRVLRYVGVGGGESVWGRVAECALMLRAASLSVPSWRSARTRPVPQGLGRANGRGVVIGPAMSRWRAVVGQGTRSARSGLGHTGFAGGHFEMLRFADGGLSGGDVVTGLSQVARNTVGRREIR